MNERSVRTEGQTQRERERRDGWLTKTDAHCSSSLHVHRENCLPGLLGFVQIDFLPHGHRKGLLKSGRDFQSLSQVVQALLLLGGILRHFAKKS